MAKRFMVDRCKVILLSPRGAKRSEDGFLPLHLFDSIYVNNLEKFLNVNPEKNR